MPVRQGRGVVAEEYLYFGDGPVEGVAVEEGYFFGLEGWTFM